MADLLEFLDSVSIDVVKRKYYNANKVNAVFEELREHAAVLDEITDIMVGVYMDRFKGKESELRALLDAETEMTADKALEYGLIDRIEERESGSSASAQRYAACMQDVLGQIPGGVRSKGVPAAPKKPAAGIDRRQALYEAEQQYHKIMKDE